jgi:trimethylamine--corrinoid protein Co-methyltransferase
MSSYEKRKASIDPIRIKPDMKIRLFSDADLKRLHEATLTVLSETGVKFPSARALKVFQEAGADVNEKTQIVKIPPDLLMKSIAKAPRSYTMGSRGSKDLDIYLDGKSTYCGTDGTGTTTVDLDTRIKRPSTKEDVGMMARVSDYLSSVGFYWPIVGALDVPEPVMSLHEIEASFVNTEKHVHIISCADPKQAKYAVEMARAVAGNTETMVNRPPLSVLTCPISPLTQEAEALDTALVFAAAKLPVGLATMPMLGVTSPASVPGHIVMGNAELLSAACYIQLVHPGTSLYYAFFSTTMNPYTGGCISSTQHQHALNAGIIELGHYYNLPVMSSCGSGDATRIDSWRAGRDFCIDTMYVYLAQPDMIPGMGLIENDTLLYPEQMMIDDHIYQSIKAMANGISISTESLALDEIMAVGAGGNFLSREYTMKNTRKLWTPDVTRTWSPQKKDFLDPHDAAFEKVKWILENHEPTPLDATVAAELKNILASAEKHLL